MSPFKGFGELSKTNGTWLPEVFFQEALPLVDSLAELKVCLYAFRLLGSSRNGESYFSADDLMTEMAANEKDLNWEQLLAGAAQAAAHHVLLTVEYLGEKLYFLNTPAARAIEKAVKKGLWRPDNSAPVYVESQRPNLFALYEQNIGPLTPILSQTLLEAEAEYPADWLADAVQIAVKKNVRNWRYIEAILRSWKEKGRGETNKRTNQENPRDYIEGDLARYIKH